MKRQLKILFAEDTDSDIELLQYNLRTSDFDITYRIVEKRQDFIAALQDFNADVIICDHSLPEFDSTEALEMCRKANCKSVFILVTGTVSEEFAAQSINNGADDYILKSNLVRLPTAIKNALQKKEAQAEKERGLALLAKSEENYRHLFNYNPMPMWIVDRQSLRFLEVNEAAIALYGYSRDEFLSMTIMGLDFQLHERNSDSALKLLDKTGPFSAGIWKQRKKDGSTIFVEITVDDLPRAETQERLMIANDITEKRKAMQQLEQQNEELKKINAELDRFVYSVSHELRAPITNMLGIVNVLRDEEDENEKALFFDALESRIEKLDGVIKDILSYSRNSRSETQLQFIDFEALVQESIKNFSSYLSAVEVIDIQADINDDINAYTDQGRITVVLNNLLHNAVVYHNLEQQRPFIKISVNVTSDTIDISVEDNGRGISEKHHENVFKMFYRASSHGDGSGLGLFMVKEIVEKLGGKVTIESEPGKGTKVSIAIPNGKSMAYA